MDEFQAIAHRALMEKEIEHLAQIQNYLGWILFILSVFAVWICIKALIKNLDTPFYEIFERIKKEK